MVIYYICTIYDYEELDIHRRYIIIIKLIGSFETLIQLKLFPAKCDTLQGYFQCVLWYKRFLYLFSMYLNFDMKNEEETFSRFLISEDSGFSRRIFSCSYIYWPIDFLPQNEFNISSNKVNPHKGHNVKFSINLHSPKVISRVSFSHTMSCQLIK